MRIPTAIGRSKAEPTFGISAGARLTVILVSGILNEALLIAALTLSFASPTALSGKPTIVKPFEAKPFEANDQPQVSVISIKIPSNPMTVPENIFMTLT